jgi:hypothetical protein
LTLFRSLFTLAASAGAMPAHELNKEGVTGSVRESRVALDLADSALASSQKSAYSRSLLPLKWVSFDTCNAIR